VVIDSTAQEKAVTYPTDTKLCRRIIARCRKQLLEKSADPMAQPNSRT
jgi:hypothetical protein